MRRGQKHPLRSAKITQCARSFHFRAWSTHFHPQRPPGVLTSQSAGEGDGAVGEADVDRRVAVVPHEERVPARRLRQTPAAWAKRYRSPGVQGGVRSGGVGWGGAGGGRSGLGGAGLGGEGLGGVEESGWLG